MSSKPGVLEPLRVRIRRFQFIVGLGFLSLVLGAMLSVSLMVRLKEGVGALPSDFLRLVVTVVLQDLWVLAVLPALCYVGSRIVPLRPWSTALGAAATGGFFVVALSFVSDGGDALTEGWGLASALRLGTFVGGALLSAQAIRVGRTAAERGSSVAQVKSVARQSEYDEFLKAAEADGARMEQRDQAAAAAAAAPAASPATPEGQDSPPGEAPKTPAA
ncbi:hypothetical protein OV208_31905 [Corallococcus sp. bb12-1]|uniref:hypothetical protein n=1 Tax=Corallococcus sp. bb12-1 TaxID=2996784 RepID=UPI00226E9E3C|nr:hypothetical protein [Corallococcus sp. bb12-1]MCY1045961.1 hypothetical protein [Corallococcus sp. bb12-1]